MRVLILGGSGMLGHTLFSVLSRTAGFNSFATLRNRDLSNCFPIPEREKLIAGVDALDFDTVCAAFRSVNPDVVINCIGLVKQIESSSRPISALSLNSIFPHRLAQLCSVAKARMVHISTDCVFNGLKGHYSEADTADADDLYGRSKLLGEISDSNAITLRTSIIGRELGSRNGLMEWFLGQRGSVRGFTNAVFNGLTTLELSRVIAERVLPNRDLCGLWHVSTSPISKHDLLVLLKDVYLTPTNIEPNGDVVIDRSLDSSRFQTATGYSPPSWPKMMTELREQEL